MTTETQPTAEAKRPANKPPQLIAYHVAERGEKKSFWTRIGAAWKHDDGKGMTIDLDLVPVSGGRIVLREPEEKKKEEKGA